MTDNYIHHDAVIVGGGFYGTTIACYLAKERGFKNIVLVEREPILLGRASYHNQARVHNGYHYPRSFTTAYRSRINLPKFLHDWPDAIKKDFTKLYAIARRNSKVTAKQFERFCREINAKLRPADPIYRDLFESHLIEDVYLAEEYVFDANQLRLSAERELKDCGVIIRVNTNATMISIGKRNTLKIALQSDNATTEFVQCHYIFNCTYSGLNQLSGNLSGTQKKLKQEITEMVLIKAPPALQALGITVMDGPFFSMIPFPSRELHTLSHVRYTPRCNWNDKNGIDPYQKLKEYERISCIDRMIRDVSRYMPSILDAKYIDSLFEIKTVLLKNESNDGRPILFEKDSKIHGVYSILGGKIDNIYDILEKLDAEVF